MSRAASSSTASPLITRPAASENSARSASPSKVMPRSYFAVRGRNRLRHVLRMQRSAAGIDVAAVGLDVQKVGGDAAILERPADAIVLAAPLAQSTSTRSLLKSTPATKSASHCAYCSRSLASPGSISEAGTTLWDALSANCSMWAKMSASIACSSSSDSL